MAPDSSLLGHHLGGTAVGLRSFLPKVAAFCVISVLILAFQAQAKSEEPGTPMELAAISPIQKDMPVSSPTLLSPADLSTGTPPVLWRNRIQIPIKEPLIQKYIRFYQGEGRRTFSDSMDRAKTCIPQMTEILESFGVPAEMVAVVLVESRFEKNASYRGAGGYWQMLAPTAVRMGLRVDRWVDERRDPIKSTKAAAKYLRQLYERYDSWLLALSAYNSGGSRITSAVKDSCAQEGELNGHRFLPARSKVYVSKVLAVMQLMREPDMYGFECPKYCKPKDFDPVMVKTPINLEEIAKWVDIPVSQLQDLNPSLRQDAMPPDSGFALRLPSGSREKFDLAYDTYRRR